MGGRKYIDLKEKPTSTCKQCGKLIVWVKSKKTGKYYLCKAVEGKTGWKYCISEFHKCEEE